MSTVSTIVRRIQELYEYERSEIYYRLFRYEPISIPQTVEARLSSCIARAVQLTPHDIEQLRNCVTLGMADALVVYAARMASLAVRRSNAKLILNGLIAIALDDDLLDRRDVGASLCLLCDAARRIQAFDPNEVKTIMEIAVPVRKKLVELCLKQLTTPERMGFTPSGFAKTFLYTPPPI